METIDDIVREMRSENPREDFPAEYGGGEVPNKIRVLSDRIEKAYKSMVEGLNDGIVERDQYIAKLTEENERLRAALKPVLDTVMDSATSDLSMELAINEAKRIYKEPMKGTNNE